MYQTQEEAMKAFQVGETFTDKGMTAEVVGVREDGKVLEVKIISFDRPHWERFFTEGCTYTFTMWDEWVGCWSWYQDNDQKNHDKLNDFSFIDVMIQLFDDEPKKSFAAVS